MTTGTFQRVINSHLDGTKYIAYSSFRRLSKTNGRLKRVLGAVFGLSLLVGAATVISTKLVTLGQIRVGSVEQYTVHSGDTLWNIASIADPEEKYDTNDVVALMEKWNGITDNQELQPGMVITLPICSGN